MNALRSALLALTLAAACGGDDSSDDSTSGSSTGEPTTGGSTGEVIGWGGVCYVDLQCGDAGIAHCAHPDGCDMPGECADDPPKGECPNDPAPLIPMPQSGDGTGTICSSDELCMMSGKECFFYDGKCGEGFKGVCLTVAECAETIPPEITGQCPMTGFSGECVSPMY